MTAFEFLFSLYGLALGLSLTVIAAGIGRAVKHRRTVPTGWMTPLLALFVALDVSTFWGAAWSEYRDLPYSYGMLVSSLAIAMVYFTAASLVFPGPEDRVKSLDDHFWANKRAVLLLVLASNIMGWVASAVVAWPTDERAASIFGLVLNGVFFLALTLPAALTRRRWLFGALIGFQVVFYVASAAALAYQPDWGAIDPDGDGISQSEARAAAARRQSDLPGAPKGQE